MLLNETANKKPIVFGVPTELIIDKGSEILQMSFSVMPEKNHPVEQMILTASWHGTGMSINPKIIDHIKQNYAQDIDEEASKELNNYYFEPSNADLHFKILARRMVFEALLGSGISVS